MRSLSISVVRAIFAREIYMLLDTVISSQVGLREESGAERAAALLPLITYKLGIVTGSNTAVEDGNSYSVSGSPVRNAAADLGGCICRQDFAGAGCNFVVTRVVRRV